MVKNLVAILLAAGTSSRLGKPKQLLLWHGKTLFQHSLEKLAAAEPEETIVVVGSTALPLGDSPLSLHLVSNPTPQRGMGKSLQLGLQLAEELGASHVLIGLVDQPLIPPAHYAELVEAVRKGHRCAATTTGSKGFQVPAVFAMADLKEFISLANPGDQGAKNLLKDLCDFSLPCEGAAFDVDTEEDLHQLKASPYPEVNG